MITVKIIKDSYNPECGRLTTIQCRYPRMIHGEVMTHRDFSRNGRSSRAVPVLTLLREDIYTPYFMMNKPGMVATEEFSTFKQAFLALQWKALGNITKAFVWAFNKQGVHKQWANRPLETYGYIDVLISSTEWANFMALRDDAGAQPEIRELAVAIKNAMEDSKPSLLEHGQWHLPYIEGDDWIAVEDYLQSDAVGNRSVFTSDIVQVLKKVSVARCARVTIRPFDGDSTIAKEVARYSLLMESKPVHASPAEHIATPDKHIHSQTSTLIDGKVIGATEIEWEYEGQHRNFHGWRQYRAMIPGNTVYENN